MRYVVYRCFLIWIIPSMYLSHEALILVCTASFVVLLSSGFTLDLWFYDYYYYNILYVHILSYCWCSIPLVSCSYHIIPCMFPTWYHLLYLYLLLYACAHDTIFNTLLWLEFIDTHVLNPARHLAFVTPLVGEFDSLDSYVQILEVGACEFSLLLVRDAQL